MKIKTILLTALVLACAAALGMYITRETKTASTLPLSPQEDRELAPDSADASEQVRPVSRKDRSVTASSPAPQSASLSEFSPEPSPTKSPAAVILDQAVRTLISPQASFQEKQAAWGQIRGAGKFDQLITELEQRFAAQPAVAEVPAALGLAYLQKAGSIDDMREQGILGMKADQTFDAALNLDAGNWDARFWKAKAMSYWPSELGKRKEVIEHCLELLKQQEVLPPQEQFAQTYVLLGEQYQAEGQPEQASEAWRRGLGLFPSSGMLREKLESQP